MRRLMLLLMLMSCANDQDIAEHRVQKSESLPKRCKAITVNDGANAGVKPVMQEQDLWCWATVAQQIAASYDIEIEQCEIVNLFPRTDEPLDCCITENAKTEKCNHPGGPAQVLKYLNIDSKYVP